MCGIGAIISLSPYNLETLMNIPLNQLYRGTKGCGIAWTDFRSIYLIKDPISPKTFKNKYELVLKTVTTKMAIIHHRLPSHGDVKYENTHPFISCPRSPVRFAFCHNGTWYNPNEYREKLEEQGHIIQGETDSEVIMHMIEEEINVESDLINAMKKFDDAGVLVAMTKNKIYVVSGSRSIYLGKAPKCVILASTIKAIKNTASKMKTKIEKYYSIKYCTISLNNSVIKIAGVITPVKPVFKSGLLPTSIIHYLDGGWYE